MHLALRSPLATLVPLLLLVPVAALIGACSSGADVEDGGGPTVTATAPDESPAGETGTPTEPTDEPTSTPADLPEAVAAVCAPYAIMVRAIKNAGFSGADPDEVAAALAPVMKEFAARVPELDRPRGMPPEAWRGIEALAVRILGLPDRPTYAEVEAVEGELSERERDAVDAAAAWLRTTCPV